MFSSYGYDGGGNDESPKAPLREGPLNARISFLITK